MTWTMLAMLAVAQGDELGCSSLLEGGLAPRDGATDVAVDARMVVVPGLACRGPYSAVLGQGATEVDAGTMEHTNRVGAAFKPSQDLEPNTTYTLTIAGEGLVETVEFTTGRRPHVALEPPAELTLTEVSAEESAKVTSYSVDVALDLVDPNDLAVVRFLVNGTELHHDFLSPTTTVAARLFWEAELSEEVCVTALIEDGTGEELPAIETCTAVRPVYWEGGCNSSGLPVLWGMGALTLLAVRRRASVP